MLVGDVWELYRRECSDDILFWKRQELAHRHLKALDGILVDNLRPSVIREATKGLAKLSSSTIRRDLQALIAAINTAWKCGQITNKPYIELPKESAPRKQWITWDQMGVVRNEARKFGQWMEMYCMLLCNTGQRSGAVISLRWKDVDLDGRCIYFSANRKSRQKCVADVAMNDDLYEYMMANRVLDGEKLVVAQNGRRPMSLNYQWRKLMVAAGLPTTITPHIIRHSVATNLVSSGVPILRVSKLLGHSSSVITEKVYAKFTPEFTKETVNAIRINGNSDRPRA